MRFLLLIVLPSCGQIRGGSQIGTENDGCEIVSTEPAPVGVPDGFSLTVADAEGMALGAFAGTVDDSAEAVTLTLTATDDAELVRTEPMEGFEIACPDYLRLPVQLALVGPDIDETTAAEVRAWEDDAITTGFVIEADQVESPVTPPAGDAVWLSLSAELSGGAWAGDVEWRVETTEGSGNDATTSLESVPIWGFVAE